MYLSVRLRFGLGLPADERSSRAGTPPDVCAGAPAFSPASLIVSVDDRLLLRLPSSWATGTCSMGTWLVMEGFKFGGSGSRGGIELRLGAVVLGVWEVESVLEEGRG